MKNAFAAKTVVQVSKSKAEIEHLLARYGAEEFAQATMPNKAAILFSVAGRRVRFVINIPPRNDERFTHKESRYGYKLKVTDRQAEDAWEQEHRRLWRSLALVIKAKLEAVASGIVTFENEFLAHFVLPNGKTVGDEIGPDLLRIHETGKQIPLLGGSFD